MTSHSPLEERFLGLIARCALQTAVAAVCALFLGGCPPLPGTTGPGGTGGAGGGGGEGAGADGAALYRSLTCASCHGADACGDEGPALHDVTFDDLDVFLRDPSSPHLGGTWPELTDAELEAIVGYVTSLSDCPEVPLKPAAQRPQYRDLSVMGIHDPDNTAYRTDCVTCHGERLDEGAPLGDIPAAHSVMKRLLGQARCRTCHGMGVDIAFRSSERLRAERIRDASCASSLCHGASGYLPFYMIDDD